MGSSRLELGTCQGTAAAACAGYRRQVLVLDLNQGSIYWTFCIEQTFGALQHRGCVLCVLRVPVLYRRDGTVQNAAVVLAIAFDKQECIRHCG